MCENSSEYTDFSIVQANKLFTHARTTHIRVWLCNGSFSSPFKKCYSIHYYNYYLLWMLRQWPCSDSCCTRMRERACERARARVATQTHVWRQQRVSSWQSEIIHSLANQRIQARTKNNRYHRRRPTDQPTDRPTTTTTTWNWNANKHHHYETKRNSRRTLYACRASKIQPIKLPHDCNETMKSEDIRFNNNDFVFTHHQ